jgi:Mpp10 protein
MLIFSKNSMNLNPTPFPLPFIWHLCSLHLQLLFYIIIANFYILGSISSLLNTRNLGIEQLTMTPNLDKHPETISNELLDVLESVDVLTSNPGVFCSASTENTTSLSLLMKSLFKVSADSTKKTFGPFQELLVEGFDSETIWEELQTRNRPLTRFVKKKIGNISDALRKEKKESQKRAKEMKKSITATIIEDNNDEGDVELDEDDDNEEPDDNSELDADVDMEDSAAEESIGENFDDDEDDEDNGDIELEIDNDDEDGFEEYEGGGDAEYDGIDDMQAWLDQQEEIEEKHQKKLERLQKLAAQKGAVEEVSSLSLM